MNYKNVPDRYLAATITPSGDLLVITTNRDTVIINKDSSQTSFDLPVISSDSFVVGVQKRFPNCCTSYDVPKQLLIYRNRKAHIFKSNMCIFRWSFIDNGSRVVFEENPTHGDVCCQPYTLANTKTGRILASSCIRQPCYEDTKYKKPWIPNWIKRHTENQEIELRKERARAKN